MSTVDAKKNSDLLTMLMALGDAYLEKGLFVEAAKRYQQLLDFKVENRQVYTHLSKAYLGLKKIDKNALEIYQRAVEYDSDNAEIYTTLALIFLKDGRVDEPAIRIYESALRRETPAFARLAKFLAGVYFRRRDFMRCKDIVEKLIAKSGYDSKTFVLYLKSCWFIGKYREAINQLKRLIDTKEDNALFLKYLCMTYLEKMFHTEMENQVSRFSFIDRQLVAEHFEKNKGFETLQDLSLYLELKKFYLDKKHWAYVEPSMIQEPAKSYAYEEVPERSDCSSKSEHTGPESFDMVNEILGRLATFESLTGKNPGAHSSLTFEDFEKEGSAIFTDPTKQVSSLTVPHDAEILITIEFSDYERICKKYGKHHGQKLRQKLYVILMELLEKYRITHIFAMSNGLLIFAKDIVASVSFSVEILNKLNRYNFVNDPKDEIHLAISIHHSRDGFAGNSKQSLKDLSIALKLSIVNDGSLTPEDRPIYGKIFKKTDRILLSAKAYRQIKNVHRFKVNSVGQFKLKYLRESLSLHEVSWRNPIDDLRFGFIKKLGRFDLLTELSSKGAIKVFKAKDSVLQRFVIIKVIQSEEFNALPANNEKRLEFYNQAKSLARMSHPNIINIYEVDEDQGLTYIAREYAEGVPIGNIFSNGNGFNSDRLIKLTYQVCKGLQYCHRLGFVHWQLKPHNILVGSNDEVKIMDFQIARRLFFDHDHMNGNYREYSYMSPEQFAGQKGDRRSDIFSLGVILYEVMTGHHPFASKNAEELANAIQSRTPPPPSQLNGDVPKFCEAFVLKCMAKHPERRFQTADEMVTLLKNTFESSLFSNFNYQIARSRDSN